MNHGLGPEHPAAQPERFRPNRANMTRGAGVSRRVIFRGQGEVGAKLKLDTGMRSAPFNLDLLEISSYEFSWGYG